LGAEGTAGYWNGGCYDGRSEDSSYAIAIALVSFGRMERGREIHRWDEYECMSTTTKLSQTRPEVFMQI